MTMTHSDEVTKGGQKPGTTDMSVGVITPQKESVESVRLVQQAARTPGALCRNSAQSHVA